ncbi:sigma-70 family RNA polymerase sigma factor [Actinoplanes sp. NPDC051343]|uniref:sigma-70 family RNA polymerase sigma factor n=1 Tax=Actinoplanes sp. NPDC051343 TaxID=3363906 RepID=UPI0037A45C87
MHRTRDEPGLDDAHQKARAAPVLSIATDADPEGKPQPAVPASADEAAALRHLQLVHRPVLLAYVLRFTNGDLHWAEDIVQETMTRAWRHPDARNAEGYWNRAWLFTIARRLAIDDIRAARVRPIEYVAEPVDAAAADGTEDAVNRLLDSSKVREAVVSLPERLRTTLIELYYMGRSIAETAELLDIPPGTVKSRSNHALRALREALIMRGFVDRDGSKR